MGLLLKLVYTIILFGLGGLVARELWMVWLDPRVFIGRFEVVTETGENNEQSAEFPKRIVAAQSLLAQQLADYQSRRGADAPTDTTYAVAGAAPIELPPEALGGVDVIVQDINLRQILSAIRRGFLSPNEVRGSVTEREGSVMAAVEWPRAPRFDGGQDLRRFLVPSRGNPQDVAAYIACSITWARVAAQEPGLADIGRVQFCDFVGSLNALYGLEESASSADGLNENQVRLVRRHVAALRRHYGGTAVFPDLYRVRADLLDLLPQPQTADLVEAQEDRLRYAMLGPDLNDLPEEQKRYAALALARPALILKGAQVTGAKDNWRGLLARHAKDIALAASATGMILDSKGAPTGTGFIVAPGVLMTTTFSLDVARRDSPGLEATGPRFCLAEGATDCKHSLLIGTVLYDGRTDGNYVTMVEVSGIDEELITPIPVFEKLPPANNLLGSYAYVIGYPHLDPRLPTDFVKFLLQDVSGVQRLMPGRILAFKMQDGQQGPLFTTDISTTGGSAGGPLIDLMSGRVIGMSSSGKWQGERGKFAYAMPLPAKALEILAQRLGTQAPDQPQPVQNGTDGTPAN